MTALPYMPLYVADYLADTAHLTTIENGAYLMLIMNYWQRGKALPAGELQLARIARVTPEEWAEMQCSLVQFFEIKEGQWFHKRIEAELAKVRDKSTKASNAGKASAEQKTNGRSTDVQRTFNHTDTDTEVEKDSLTAIPKDASEKSGESEILAEALTGWNDLASLTGLPAVQVLTPPRKTALRLRLNDLGGIDGWHHLLAKIRAGPHLTGHNERGWKASFDWVLKPANLTKIMEGNYDAADNSHSKPGSITGAFAELDAAIAEARRREAGTSGDAGQEIVGWQT